MDRDRSSAIAKTQCKEYTNI